MGPLPFGCDKTTSLWKFIANKHCCGAPCDSVAPLNLGFILVDTALDIVPIAAYVFDTAFVCEMSRAPSLFSRIEKYVFHEGGQQPCPHNLHRNGQRWSARSRRLCLTSKSCGIMSEGRFALEGKFAIAACAQSTCATKERTRHAGDVGILLHMAGCCRLQNCTSDVPV